jgi:hypothetical protein
MDASNWQNQVTPQHCFKQANVKIKECSMKSLQQKNSQFKVTADE